MCARRLQDACHGEEADKVEAQEATGPASPQPIPQLESPFASMNAMDDTLIGLQKRMDNSSMIFI